MASLSFEAGAGCKDKLDCFRDKGKEEVKDQEDSFLDGGGVEEEDGVGKEPGRDGEEAKEGEGEGDNNFVHGIICRRYCFKKYIWIIVIILERAIIWANIERFQSNITCLCYRSFIFCI